MSIITFYSYKGGVGRSMTMANIAVLMAQRGLKVLAVDWDLEAPGLERYFSYFEQSSSSGGLLPFLTSASDALQKGEDVPSYREHVWTVNVGVKHSFSLIPSGRDTHISYAELLERFDWRRFFSFGGGDFLEQLRDEWRGEFDAVLIDSRTGMSDAGGICTIQMPDVLVAMFTSNDQSILGVFDVIQAAQRGRQHLAYDRMPLTVLPVACRFASNSELERSSLWLDRFAEQFSGVCDDWLLPWIPYRAVFERLKIPQVDWFSFGERLAVIEQGVLEPGSLGFACDRITDLLASDFKSLDAALGPVVRRPPNWQRREALDRSKIDDLQDDYRYDIFVSYQHGGVVTEWVRNFVSALVDWLALELPYEPRVYLDSTEFDVGQSWHEQYEDAVKHSKLLLAILTPAYVASESCRREWAIFEEREQRSGSRPLIFPVVLRGGAHLPNWVQRRASIDASDMTLFGHHRTPTKREYSLLQESAAVIARMLAGVGPFDRASNAIPHESILARLVQSE